MRASRVARPQASYKIIFYFYFFKKFSISIFLVYIYIYMKNKRRRTLKKSMRGNFRKKSRRKTRKIPRKRTRKKRYIGGGECPFCRDVNPHYAFFGKKYENCTICTLDKDHMVILKCGHSLCSDCNKGLQSGREGERRQAPFLPDPGAAPAAAAPPAAAPAAAPAPAEAGGWGWPSLDVLTGLGAPTWSSVNLQNYLPAYPTGGAAGEQQAQRQRDHDSILERRARGEAARNAAPRTAVQAEAIRLLGLNGDQLHSEGGTAPITYLMRGNLMRLVNGGAITGENWVPPAGSPQYISDLVLNIAPGGALCTLSEILPHLVRHEVGLCTCDQYTGPPGPDYLREITMGSGRREALAEHQDPGRRHPRNIETPDEEARDLGRWAVAQRNALGVGEDRDGPWHSDRARGSAENVAENFRKWSNEREGRAAGSIRGRDQRGQSHIEWRGMPELSINNNFKNVELSGLIGRRCRIAFTAEGTPHDEVRQPEQPEQTIDRVELRHHADIWTMKWFNEGGDVFYEVTVLIPDASDHIVEGQPLVKEIIGPQIPPQGGPGRGVPSPLGHWITGAEIIIDYIPGAEAAPAPLDVEAQTVEHGPDLMRRPEDL
jgi:hypothetical protein